MKIPKPKIKKPEFTKPGKPKSGNRFLKRNLLSLIVIAVLVIGTGTAYGTLSAQDADRGDDPVYGVDPDRYQVLVSGKGYKLSKQQEKQYKLQKKQNEVNASKALEVKSNSSLVRTTRGSRLIRSSRYSYRGRTFKVSKNPRVSTDIKTQIDYKTSWKAGDTLTFRVSAYAYPYRSKDAISKDNIKVTASGGGTVTYDRTSSGYHYYSVVLAAGTNKITITATDKSTKKQASTGPYTIKAGKGSSSGGNSGGKETDPAKEELDVTAKADLSDYGIGEIELTGTVTSGQTAYDFLKKCSDVEMDGKDIKCIYLNEEALAEFSFNKISTSQLQEIFKKDQNVTGTIDEGDYELWLDEAEQAVRDNGYIGIDSPFKNTKWEYDPDQKITKSTDIDLELVLYYEE